MAKTEDKILDHDYDGIKEYDNPLPPWWVALFIITIIWSVAYIFYYHIAGIGKTQFEEYSAEMSKSSENTEQLAGKMAAMWANIKFEQLKDPKDISAGMEIFHKNCISCHGDNGQGGIGPNLTDDYYLHGKGIENTMKTIMNGVPDKGMISWKPLLKPEEIQKVASFVLSIHGSNPANPKAPQGTLIKE